MSQPPSRCVEEAGWRGIYALLLFLIAPLFWGCTATGYTPFFIDDGERGSLFSALQRHESYLSSSSSKPYYTVADTQYSREQLKQSLQLFRNILKVSSSQQELDESIRCHFSIYRAKGRSGFPTKEMLITGYFEPLLEGSLTKEEPFVYPLYTVPDDLVKRPAEKGRQVVRRRDGQGRLHPYWTREEIDENNVLSGNELVYLRSRFETFLLHVQGSGKVRLRDGSIRSVRYAGNNGHAYSSIGKKLVDDGEMMLEKVDMEAIRTYLRKNRAAEKPLLYHNKRYIFFAWGKDHAAYPRGSLGIELTPGRSIAIDGSALPHGAIGYLVSRRPVIDANGTLIDWEKMHRFVFPQDSGAAIKGSGRADLFWGSGDSAGIAAGAMKEKGQLYFLLPKQP